MVPPPFPSPQHTSSGLRTDKNGLFPAGTIAGEGDWGRGFFLGAFGSHGRIWDRWQARRYVTTRRLQQTSVAAEKIACGPRRDKTYLRESPWHLDIAARDFPKHIANDFVSLGDKRLLVSVLRPW